MSQPQDFSRNRPATPPVANDPLGNNVSAVVQMSNGQPKGSDTAGGNASVLSGLSDGSQEHGTKKHNTRT
jgi:hypothetical protein